MWACLTGCVTGSSACHGLDAGSKVGDGHGLDSDTAPLQSPLKVAVTVLSYTRDALGPPGTPLAPAAAAPSAQP